MSDATGRFWIIFNGEIYNYRDLRSLLEQLGYSFVTSSDTEVILAAFVHWGESCVERLRGMFAFAIWDKLHHTVFAARDPFGEKPFYYVVDQDNTLIIASEIKSILASGLVDPQIALDTVDAYLALGYVPPDRTIYSNIKVLLPAHVLTWANSTIRTSAYWHPVFASDPITPSNAAERLLELLQRAVKRQMVADVPVGAFLSGGLDSSTIVALMQAQLNMPVKTFSVGFGEYINELPYARAVAEKYATDHHEIDLGVPDVSEMLLRMAAVYDEPFADSSNIPTYLIAEFARKHVKVVLTGDGADELFGGYTWSYPALAKSTVVPRSLALWLVLRSASKLLQDKWKWLALYSSASGLATRGADAWSRRVHQSIFITSADRRRIWGERSRTVEPYYPGKYYCAPSDLEGLNQGFYFDLKSYLPGDILVKVDRAAMANGLETRAPFLDRDLAEFALSLPANLKVNATDTKVILQKACSSFWPPQLRGRKKQGFGAPIDDWLRFGSVKELCHQVFSGYSRLAQLLPGVHARRRGQVISDWHLLVLGLWLEQNRISV